MKERIADNYTSVTQLSDKDLGIAIPTYNRNLYLCKLLDTIPSNLKVFVSDNGNFVNEDVKLKFSNAQFIHHPEVIEIFDNWNAAAVATASQVSWCIIPSDDDVFFEDTFQIVGEYIKKYPKADVIIFGHKIIDENDNLSEGWIPASEKVYPIENGFELFKYGVNARMPCVLFKSELLKKINFFDSFFKLTAADSDLIQRALLAGTAVFVPKVIGAYRVWAGALTHRRMATKQWLDEVDHWQNKIVGLISAGPYARQAKHIMDEVYAQNMLGGIYSLRKSGTIKDRLRFVISNRFPWRASLKLKFKIIAGII